jgi:hypothetical protein
LHSSYYFAKYKLLILHYCNFDKFLYIMSDILWQSRLRSRFPANRKICKWSKCRAEYRRFPHLFDFRQPEPCPGAGNVQWPLKTPTKWAFKSGVRAGRGWRWEASEDEHRLLDQEGRLIASFVPAQTGYCVFHPWTAASQRTASLDDVKRLAISLAFANLPVGPRAKVNRLPETLPRCLPSMESYLAGLVRVIAYSEAPSIVPEESGGDVRLVADDDLAIPEFLRRAIQRRGAT